MYWFYTKYSQLILLGSNFSSGLKFWNQMSLISIFLCLRFMIIFWDKGKQKCLNQRKIWTTTDTSYNFLTLCLHAIKKMLVSDNLHVNLSWHIIKLIAAPRGPSCKSLLVSNLYQSVSVYCEHNYTVKVIDKQTMQMQLCAIVQTHLNARILCMYYLCYSSP